MKNTAIIQYLFRICLSLLCFGISLPISAGEPVPLKELSNPDSILVNGDHLYITQFPQVYIYSLNDFTLIKKFGVKGEGPGEFNRFTLIAFHNNNLVIGDRNKVLFFTLDGVFIREQKAKSIIHWGAIPFGKNYTAKSRVTVENTAFDTINLYDAGLNKLSEIARTRFFFQPRGSKKCFPLRLRGIEFHVYQNRLYVKGNDQSSIEVYDISGQKLYTIKAPPDKREIPETDKKRFHEYFKTTRPWKRLYESQIRSQLVFPENYPPIQMFYVDNGRIYVLSYQQKDSKTKFTVLDLMGNLLRKVYIPFNTDDTWFNYSITKQIQNACHNPTFTISNGKIYWLSENPDSEEWELHLHDI